MVADEPCTLIAPPLAPVPSCLADDALGTRVARHTMPAAHGVSMRVLRPFSWDAKHRAFEIVTISLPPGSVRHLVCGPYATADAAAWNADPQSRLPFPNDPATDGVTYTTTPEIPGPDSEFQDAAGWFTIAGSSPQRGAFALAAAIDRSDTVIIRVSALREGTRIDVIVPTALASATAVERRRVQPRLHTAETAGSHEDARALLRAALRAVMPPESRDEPPPLIADTWGFDTAIDHEVIRRFVDSSVELGVEVITLDKGWERSVGEWRPRPSVPGGVAGLSTELSTSGVRLGLWMGLGNIDLHSESPLNSPEHLATWRGQPQTVSHRTHQLCIAHEPVRVKLEQAVDRLVAEGLTWLLHDFETIGRCDATHHTHPAEDGEHFAVTGWYRLLERLRRQHPQLRIENCWNGGRPLDLQMVAHHDTTIGDDWCDSAHALQAKIGLGEYLPASWCSSYMSDEPGRAPEGTMAVFAIGGPWVIMGDPASWSERHRSVARAAIAAYARWQARLPFLFVTEARVRSSADTPISGARGIEVRDGDEMLVALWRENDAETEPVFWVAPRGTAVASWRDEFKGSERVFESGGRPPRLELSGAGSAGALWSITVAPLTS